ncbi:hypothetical protein E6W36_11860 [Hankyongella ginsenosidimutans]|uniref:NolW-like domain-containing protein n=1 Tax=Hankyongella ginsenosidimutans TaxID=1763828 RepID=A0A4D7C2M6_9SPHN|nr:hypothetical protein [Hankyongella ginsenosidimutans]QCI79954.1 hypothetical protein E6W36_11860 [Hankyongella ginsenosidimutans]
MFEDALRAANLALVAGSGGYRIVPTGAAASTSEIANSEAVGYATETIQLKFVTAPEMRKLIEPILPGVVDNASQGTQLVIKGATGQRSSVRELVKQFDVNWLRNMSFGLYIPKQTDARLIVPELEKLINGNDAPTKGLVRLIAMEKLNGILAVSIQPQYLEDVQRWVNVLDREGRITSRACSSTGCRTAVPRTSQRRSSQHSAAAKAAAVRTAAIPATTMRRRTTSRASASRTVSPPQTKAARSRTAGAACRSRKRCRRRQRHRDQAQRHHHQ